MTWLFPLGLLGVLSVPVLAWLWRFATRSRQVTVSSLAPFEHLLARPPRHRLVLIVNRLFWLQVLALLALAIALAQPALSLPHPTTTLVIADTSASMAAGRAFERVRRRLREQLNRKPSAEQWFLVTTAPMATLTARPSSDRGELSRAIDTLTPADLSGDLGAAVSLGQAFVGGAVDRLLVVTDEPQPPAGAAGPGVTWVSVGQPLANAAIVGVDAETPLCDQASPSAAAEQDTSQVVVTVQAATQKPSTGRVIAQHGKRRLAQAEVPLAPGDRSRVLLAVPADVEGWVDVTLHAPGDALAVDNRARVYVRRRSAVTPVVVQADEPAFRQAVGRWLEACPGLSWSEKTQPTAQPHVLIARLAGGQALAQEIVTPAEAVGVLELAGAPPGDRRPAPLAWVVNADHPVGAYFSPVETVPTAVVALDSPTIDRSAVKGEPVVWALHEGVRRPLVVAEERDGVRRVSFFMDPFIDQAGTPYVTLFFNSLRWLMGKTAAIRTGEPIALFAPSGPIEVRRPDGAIERLSHAGGMVRYDATSAAGTYQLRQGEWQQEVAVNFLDPLESDLITRRSTWRLLQPLERVGRPPSEGRAADRRPLSRMLIGLAVALLLAEWWLYRRHTARAGQATRGAGQGANQAEALAEAVR